MKRSVLFIALLLSVVPAGAGPKDYGTITTRAGKSFYECKVMRIYPDGVSFTHRNGAAKIAFADLPENLRNEFRYDPKAEAEYQKEQAALRKAEQERQKQQEIAMQEQLMEAKMAEASYLATASRLASTPTVATASPQSPPWVGSTITGPAMGGTAYSNGSYSRFGYGYYGGGYYPGYSTGVSYGYPYYGGYSYGSYPYYGGYSYGSYPYYGNYGYGPSVFGSWNVGHGIHIGIGAGGGSIGVFGGHHHH